MPTWLETWLALGIITGIINSLYLGTRYDFLDVSGRDPKVLLFLLVSAVIWPIICLVSLYNLGQQVNESSQRKAKNNEWNKSHLEYKNTTLDKMGDNDEINQALTYFDRNKSIKNFLILIRIIKEQKELDDSEVQTIIKELKNHIDGMSEIGNWYIRIPKQKEESELQKSIRLSSPKIKYRFAKELCEGIIMHEGRNSNYKIIENWLKTEAVFN